MCPALFGELDLAMNMGDLPSRNSDSSTFYLFSKPQIPFFSASFHSQAFCYLFAARNTDPYTSAGEKKNDLDYMLWSFRDISILTPPDLW